MSATSDDSILVPEDNFEGWCVNFIIDIDDVFLEAISRDDDSVFVPSRRKTHYSTSTK